MYDSTYGDLAQFQDLANDEYIQHLQFIVGGYLFKGNIEAFECAIRNMPDNGAMIEIGSFLGLSTNIIAYGAHKFGRKNPFITCDPWIFAGSDKLKAGYFSTGTQQYRDWVITIYKMNLRMFSPNFMPYTIETASDTFFKQWANSAPVIDILGREVRMGGPISFAYIDGDHTYEVSKRDFINLDKFLLPGGYVVFDDSADSSSYVGIKKLIQEIRAGHHYELILKTPNYCFRKKI